MPYLHGNHYNIKYIKQFYSSLKFKEFVNLTTERKDILDKTIEANRLYYKNKTDDLFPLICDLAYVLLYIPKRFRLENDDEKVYLFIQFIDPELKFLEAYECANIKKEIKANCLLNFNYYDNCLIQLEQAYNKRFNVYGPDDLWSRESIKRARIKNDD